jgi:hypothetical protein
MMTKNYFPLLCVCLFIASCSNTPSIEETIAHLKTLYPQTVSVVDTAKVQIETVPVIESLTVPMDSVTYWKMVRDSCPELFRKVPLSPYEAFEKCQSAEMRGWDSEVGIDNYFQRYAKVLRRKSGKAMKSIRNDTQEAMRLLNFISHELSGGGTFYGHILVRAEGDLEYSLYKYEHGAMDFIAIDLVKERGELFREWKKNIHKSITRDGSMNFTDLSDVELEKQLLDSLSRMKSLVKSPFTLTYLEEFGHRFYSDLNF